jgi:Acetyltransferase (GNAT) domain
VLELRRLDVADVDWNRLDRFDDRTVFQTRAWAAFLSETQGAQPVVAELRDGSATAGYFTGFMVRRMGLRILGSSFPGWATPYIGFNLLRSVSHSEALKALEAFAFKRLGCSHLEVSDRRFSEDDGRTLGFQAEPYHTFETDLTASEDEIFKQMSSACRRCIRKAARSGVRIVESHDEAFAEEYHEQLKDVFARQDLIPTYGVDRVRSLIRHLLPTGHLLLLRAVDAGGGCIATGIYPGMNRVAELWGNASFRRHQHLRPNESLHWYAMRYWRERGAELFDWGGGGDYKKKYGGRPVTIPWFTRSRFPILTAARREARQLFVMKQRLMGRLHKATSRRREPALATADETD